MLADTKDIGSRTPFYCSGCPHNTSTVVPEGSIAGAGIGCHFMALWMDRDTVGFTQMGGEGAQWIGQAPFSKREHFFQNLGDGTYNHSGILALRFALAAGVNITYKILYNDAVAMTGGQPHEGGLTVDMIARQVQAEGVRRIAVVSDEPGKYDRKKFPDDRDVPSPRRPRSRPARVARGEGRLGAALRPDLRGGKAPAAQARHVSGPRQARHHQRTCLRRLRRLRREVELRVDPACRDRIRPQAADRPVELQQGFLLPQRLLPVIRHRARRKAQARPTGIAGKTDPLDGVPEPRQFPLDQDGWASIIDGVGGTGVVTIGAILGMAAHLEGKGCGMIDMAGLAQKGGSVFSHVRIAKTPDDIHAIRVSAGKADLILGCDLVVSGARKVLAAVRENHTIFVANTAEIMPGEFARSADFSLPGRTAEEGDPPGGGRGKVAFLRRNAHGVGPFRQFARRQHVHAWFRLPVWRTAAFGRSH